MKKTDRRRQSAEINAIRNQIDCYLASAAKPDGNPIYQRLKVKAVESTDSISEDHPLCRGKQSGAYATEHALRGTLLCHYGGILDFYENNDSNAKLRNNYCIGQADCDVYTSGKRQFVKTGGRSNGHNILVASYDKSRKWVGNAAGYINDRNYSAPP